MIDVHDIQPGKFGLVAHKMLTTQMNFLLPQQTQSNYSINGMSWYWADHIPHGTLVLVVGKVRSPSPKTYFYKVIWGDRVGWVNKEHLINPEANADVRHS